MFDEYDIIPTGFSAAGAPMPRNRDGKLDVAEGLVYTDLLEVMLERRTTPLGTSVQYMNLYPFDLREENPGDRAAGFQRSTAGLAGQALNSTADSGIRFLVHASSTTAHAPAPLATQGPADVPH